MPYIELERIFSLTSGVNFHSDVKCNGYTHMYIFLLYNIIYIYVYIYKFYVLEISEDLYVMFELKV